MTEKAYEVVHLDELDRFPVDDEGLLWRPVRRRLGITAFGTNAYTAEQGTERVVEEHHEQDGHEELYFVASGRATFVLGDEEIDAPAGTFIHAEPGTKRGAVATEPNTTVLAIGAKPGVPHEISSMGGDLRRLRPLPERGRGRGARASDRIRRRQRGPSWQGHYNAACLEALTKNRDGAIEHLKRAIELDPQAKEYAANDTDFDWLRDDPEFPA